MCMQADGNIHKGSDITVKLALFTCNLSHVISQALCDSITL